MGRFYKGGRSYGHRRALEHIHEAERLTQELGGTDEDVKKYFFSLSSQQLKPILEKYESGYGRPAREYAEETFSKWKNGRVHMSGMVAGRLFNLLPPYMPLQAKYKLTQSLWKHIGPSSNKTYYIGTDSELDEVISIIKSHLEQVVVHYKIPESMERRFNWLSLGDVGIKQQLLNHLRQQEKALLLEALKTQLPILTNHLRRIEGTLTNHVVQVLDVGKHKVRVIVDSQVNGITETVPRHLYHSSNDDNFGWIWWVIGICVLLWLLFNNY